MKYLTLTFLAFCAVACGGDKTDSQSMPDAQGQAADAAGGTGGTSATGGTGGTSATGGAGTGGTSVAGTGGTSVAGTGGTGGAGQDGGGSDTGTGTDMGPTCQHECTAGAKRCTEAMKIQECIAGANGCRKWSTEAACPGPQVCNPAMQACACPDNCELGISRCAPTMNGDLTNEYQFCENVNGCRTWGPTKLCPAGKICEMGGAAFCANP